MITIYYSSWVDLVQAGATIGLVIAAILAFCIAKRQLGALKDSADQQRLSALMNEITGDEASFDRGLVRSRDLDNAEEIREYVERGRSLTRKIRYDNIMQAKTEIYQNELEQALIGLAIEKTIVRYDRVAFYILTGNNKFRFVPEWVLSDVNMIWLKLHRWIQFRRNTEDAEYKNPQYAKDLERLFTHPDTKKLRPANHDLT